MPPTPLEADSRARLAADLEALDGVRRATVDESPLAIWLVCERTDAPVELLARSQLAGYGLDAGAVPVHVSYLPGPEPRRRVRFVAAAVAVPRTGQGRAEVELEWGGRGYRGEAEGESGAVMELRLSAVATLRALEAVLEGRLTFDLVGIKLVRAFDADVVVALLRTSTGAAMVGAALAAGEAHRAVALAVLNATNRLLGNYLSVGDPTAD